MIHIRDSVCKMETRILSQLLKQRNGRMFDLRQLFVPNEPEVTNTSSSATSNLCVICQTESISRAFLPCRHTCVCGLCFDKIDKCPLCRSSFTSYFKLGEERYGDEENEPSEPADAGHQERSGWFTRMNRRINSWL
jgi:Zinc finger, C3HC4 type (RING finger)